jgi:uncharacterized protein (TIGR02147 family)
MENMNITDYRDTLNEFFLIKKEMNPDYSMRAFARDIGMPSSNFSSVMSYKQGLSLGTAEQIVKKLRIQGDEKSRFIDSVLSTDARSKKEKILAQARLKRSLVDENKKELQEDYFKLISEWYYFTIIELLTVEDFSSKHEWIANTLELNIKIVDTAMARLLRLGLIKLIDGEYKSTNIQMDTLNDIPSTSLKKYGMQILKKSSEALIEQDVDKREFQTLTIAINQNDIPFVKTKIREFKNNLDKELMARTANSTADKVYCLAIQFFDLLKGEK